MTHGVVLSTRRRFAVLAGGCVAGTILFLPFMSAGSGHPITALWPFFLVASIVSVASVWPGLMLWDRVGLPMPILRGIERGQLVAPDRRSLTIAGVCGLLGGVAALLALNALNAPEMPGSLAARLASAGFAAITLEVVVHLLGMGIVVRVTRRVWIGVVTTALVFVAFHLTGSAGLSPALLLLSVCANGGLALILGWIGAALGFEYLVVAHTVAHMVTVGAG